MKNYTLKDATKEELIQYFFTSKAFGGGFTINANKEQFLIWLANKRAKELYDAQEQTLNASNKALEEYINLVKKANDTQDTGEKLNILIKADAAYKRYENFNKKSDILDKKICKALDI